MENLLIYLSVSFGALLLMSPLALLIGLFKIFFQKEDKKFGIQLIIYSSIVLIIGLGTCLTGGFIK